VRPSATTSRVMMRISCQWSWKKPTMHPKNPQPFPGSSPKGSIRLTGLFPTYAYRLTSGPPAARSDVAVPRPRRRDPAVLRAREGGHGRASRAAGRGVEAASDERGATPTRSRNLARAGDQNGRGANRGAHYGRTRRGPRDPKILLIRDSQLRNSLKRLIGSPVPFAAA